MVFIFFFVAFGSDRLYIKETWDLGFFPSISGGFTDSHKTQMNAVLWGLTYPRASWDSRWFALVVARYQGNCLKIPVIYHIDFWGQKSNGHWANNCSRTHTYDGGGGAVRTKERGKDTRPKLARIFYAIDRKNELFLQHSSLDMASDRSIWVVAFHIPTSKFLWPGCWDRKLFKLRLHLNYGVIWLWNRPMEIIRLFGKGVGAGIIAFWSKALTVWRNSAGTIVSDWLVLRARA